MIQMGTFWSLMILMACKAGNPPDAREHQEGCLTLSLEGLVRQKTVLFVLKARQNVCLFHADCLQLIGIQTQ